LIDSSNYRLSQHAIFSVQIEADFIDPNVVSLTTEFLVKHLQPSG